MMWYNTCTSLICSHGIGKFSSNFNTACGMYFNALGWSSQLCYHLFYIHNNTHPRYTLLSWRYFLLVMSPWSRMIFLTCSGGMSSFWASTNPNFLFSLYLFVCNCCHFLAVICAPNYESRRNMQTITPFSCSRSSVIGGGSGIGASCLSNRGTAISQQLISCQRGTPHVKTLPIRFNTCHVLSREDHSNNSRLGSSWLLTVRDHVD